MQMQLFLKELYSKFFEDAWILGRKSVLKANKLFTCLRVKLFVFLSGKQMVVTDCGNTHFR